MFAKCSAICLSIIPLIISVDCVTISGGTDGDGRMEEEQEMTLSCELFWDLVQSVGFLGDKRVIAAWDWLLSKVVA